MLGAVLNMVLRQVVVAMRLQTGNEASYLLNVRLSLDDDGDVFANGLCEIVVRVVRVELTHFVVGGAKHGDAVTKVVQLVL